MSAGTRAYERLAGRLCSETAVLNHGFWSGLAPAGRGPAAVYRRHRRLFGPRAIEALRDASDRRPEGSDGRRRARQLLAFALESRVLSARLPADARAADAEARALVRVGGRTVPLVRIRGALAREPDPARRRQLLEGADRLVQERIDPLLAAARDRELEALAAVGIGSRRAAVESSGDVDLGALAAEAARFLDASAAEYRVLLAERARSQGLGPGELEAADLPLLVDAGAGEPSLDPPALRTAYEAAVGGLGLDPTASGRISIDLEPRRGKGERSFCVPASVPGDVRVVIGCDELGGARPAILLHEAGHAQHRAHTDRSLDVPARLLGDSSVTESYAFLFEALAPGGEDRFASLLLVRRYCALLVAELELDRRWGREGEAASRERFAAAMTAATGVRWSGARLLRAPDPGFYAARYLRGWMLAALWRGELRARFGGGWASEPEAGAWLRRLWADGQRRDAGRLAEEETAGTLGFAALDFGADQRPGRAPAGARLDGAGSGSVSPPRARA